MTRSNCFIICLSVSLAAWAATPAAQPSVKLQPLDFSLHRALPEPSTPWYGWQLFSWKDWMMRPSSGPLLIPLPPNHPALRVFEARFAGVLNQPVTKFSESYLHNLATIERLDPNSIHRVVNNPNAFTVETFVPFPNEWANLIEAGKMAKVLSTKSSGDLDMVSEFGYFSQSQIQSNQRLLNIVRLLDVTGRTPYAINVQGITTINEIAQFGSMITFFYKLDESHTLMVSDFALGLKNKILKLGFTGAGLNFTGESVLLGENHLLNTTSGIGSGLPNYTEELFLDMYRGLNQP